MSRNGGQSQGDGKPPPTRIQRGLADRAGWWDRALERPLAWAVVAVLGCTWLLLPRVGVGPPEWEPDEVATFDVVIPYDMTLPDDGATEAAKREARQAVLPVYDLEPRLRAELEDEIRVLFAACRSLQEEPPNAEMAGIESYTALRGSAAMAPILEEAACSADLETALVEVVNQVFAVKIVDDRRQLERLGERGLILRNLASGGERAVAWARVADAVDVRNGLEPLLQARLLERPAVSRAWIKPVVGLLEANIGPNLVYNRAETEQRRREAADAVLPRSRDLKRGQVLVRRGDTVSEEVAGTLRALDRERRDVATGARVSGIAFLVALIMVGWWLVLRSSDAPGDSRRALSIAYILVLLFAGVDRLGLYLATAIAFNAQGPLLSTVEVYLWGLPFAAGPATVFVLLGWQPALLFAVCGAGIAGVLLGGDFSLAIFALVSGVVGVLATERSKDRASFSRVGLVIGAANVAAMLVLELYQGLPDAPALIGAAAAFAFIGGPVSLGIVSFLLPILENIFGITTDTRLLELSNQNLPLLKRLSLEAPGTYQHSLAVSNLAEAGADAVGANALLLRVCAYYHDIGKLVKPEYFVENQRGVNPHDELAPSMSALVIQSHVKEGLEMAREANLPMPIRHSIATHHGTKLIRYFYSKALERGTEGKTEARESDYRYPGPRPNTKEMGILMLADAVEAAARTLDNPSPAKIQGMIDQIFSNALEDDQLDDCELTFSELDKVASAFLWVLTNMYHHRIDYPGFDFNRRRRMRDTDPHHLAEKTLSAGS
jgi:putative nucleotidyltransferase with HDIG domain